MPPENPIGNGESDVLFRPEELSQVSEGDKDGRLSEDAAHNEANMMRSIQNKDNLEYGWELDGNFSPEEYDRAERAVEEIKKLAETEPATAKVLYKLKRIAMGAGKLGEFALQTLWMDLDAIMKPVVSGYPGYRADKTPSAEFEKNITRFYEDLSLKLTDAQLRLDKLKKSGNEFAKQELKT